MILVTGGAGFIGSHIVRALSAENQAVRVLDNFSTGRRENLTAGQVEVLEGDLRDPAAVVRAVAGVEAVCHQAALIGVPQTVADPQTSHQINVEGTVRLLEAARQAGVKRFVLASSAAVYGDEPSIPKTEDSPLAPRSPYALHKLIGEQYLRLYHEVYGMDTISLRYFNVFGPRQNPASPYAAVIPLFIQALAERRAPTIYGDGGQTRDFVYVADVARANLAALQAPDPRGQVFNIAGGRRISLLELLSQLERIFNFRTVPIFSAPRPGDVRHSVASIDLAHRVLNYAPTTSLDEGLAVTAQWMMSQG